AAKAGIAALTVIAALELQRYGVTVNCLAPNARTRMTEGTFPGLSDAEQAFDPWDPANATPIVVALCADEAQAITGQCFFVYGEAVNALGSWGPGELFTRDGGWPAGELLDELTARFPDGVAPEGLLPLFAAASEHQLLDPG